MAEFKKFKIAVQNQMDKLTKDKVTLFETAITKDDLWNVYLSSFPEGSDEKFRERTEHDCSCCRQFIKNYGNIVSIVDNKVVSIWEDLELEYPYDIVASKMARAVKAEPVNEVFISRFSKLGTDKNHEEDKKTGKVRVWNHFYYELPTVYVNTNVEIIESDKGKLRTAAETFKRAMEELTLDAGQTILDLINQNSIYRGEEHKKNIEAFIKAKKEYTKLPDALKHNWIRSNLKGTGTAHIRNTVIGSLLIDLSEGNDLEVSVKKFEQKVAPANYKRPKALVTKKMIEEAQKKIIELGYSDSLGRRHAQVEDITVNNVLFVNRSTKQKIEGPLDVFEDMKKDVKVTPKTFDKVEEISIDKFVKDVLPTASNIQVMIENKHIGNLVSLISPINKDAACMLKWNNNFSWAYNGDIADSELKAAVRAAGGRVDGDLRFSFSWNHTGQNQSLMDLHVFFPDHDGQPTTKCHDSYGNNRRVGWNNRNDYKTGGVQDVDNVDRPGKRIPVENITFPNKNRLLDGKYKFKIHNWQFRSPCTTGFKAEIALGDDVYTYDYPKVVTNKEWVEVAEATLKNGIWTIKHKIPHGDSIIDTWNIKTNTFVNVSTMMFSPNYWDGQKGIGNKHYFFMLEGCKNSDQPRGFFNEFLKDELSEHRKVFEILGSKMKVEDSDNQLSGLGFSSTQRNSIIAKIDGNFKRTLKINF